MQPGWADTHSPAPNVNSSVVKVGAWAMTCCIFVRQALRLLVGRGTHLLTHNVADDKQDAEKDEDRDHSRHAQRAGDGADGDVINGNPDKPTDHLADKTAAFGGPKGLGIGGSCSMIDE